MGAAGDSSGAEGVHVRILRAQIAQHNQAQEHPSPQPGKSCPGHPEVDLPNADGTSLSTGNKQQVKLFRKWEKWCLGKEKAQYGLFCRGWHKHHPVTKLIICPFTTQEWISICLVMPHTGPEISRDLRATLELEGEIREGYLPLPV